MAAYQHKTRPTLYAYRQGCRCAGCRAKNNEHSKKFQAQLKVRRAVAKADGLVLAAHVGPIERSVRAGLVDLVDQPWLETWKLLAIQHARTMDTIAETGQNHLAGTAHAKLVESLDRLRPPTSAAGQVVKQGVSDAERFANDL